MTKGSEQVRALAGKGGSQFKRSGAAMPWVLKMVLVALRGATDRSRRVVFCLSKGGGSTGPARLGGLQHSSFG